MRVSGGKEMKILEERVLVLTVDSYLGLVDHAVDTLGMTMESGLAFIVETVADYIRDGYKVATAFDMVSAIVKGY